MARHSVPILHLSTHVHLPLGTPSWLSGEHRAHVGL